MAVNIHGSASKLKPQYLAGECGAVFLMSPCSGFMTLHGHYRPHAKFCERVAVEPIQIIAAHLLKLSLQFQLDAAFMLSEVVIYRTFTRYFTLE